MNTITSSPLAADVLAYGPYHHGWCGPGPWIFIPIAFWLLVIAFVVLRCRRSWGGRWANRPNAEATLADLFARGEIDADEYRRRRDVLRERK